MTNEFYMGRRSGFCYALEDVAFGTANDATTWSWAGQIEKVSDDDKQNVQDISCMDGSVDTRTTHEFYAMTPEFGATVEGKLQHFRFPGLGVGPDTMDPSGTHTIVPGNTLKSFSMQVKLGHTTPYVRQWTGCMVKTMELNVSKGDWLRFSLGISAQKMTRIPSMKGYQSSALPCKKYTTAQMRPYRGSDMTTKINDVDISDVITQARFTIDNDLLVEPSMDEEVGNFTSEPIPQLPKISAGITVKMKDYALEDLFLAGAAVDDNSFKWTRGSDSLTISWDNAIINKNGNPVDIGGGVVIQELAMDIPTCTIVEVNDITTDYDTAEA